MRNVTTFIECNGCETKTKVLIKDPGLFNPSLTTFDCSGCKSEILAKISKAKGKGVLPNQVSIASKITKLSPLLLQMIKEEEKHNQLEGA